jgi:hypothetical protein
VALLGRFAASLEEWRLGNDRFLETLDLEYKACRGVSDEAKPAEVSELLDGEERRSAEASMERAASALLSVCGAAAWAALESREGEAG